MKKITLKRILSLVLIITMLLPIVTACGKIESSSEVVVDDAFEAGWALFENDNGGGAVSKAKSSLSDIDFTKKASEVKETFTEAKELIVEKTADGKERVIEKTSEIKESATEQTQVIKEKLEEKIGSIDTDFGDELGNIMTEVLSNNTISAKELLDVCEGVVTDEQNIDFALGAIASGITVFCCAGKFGTVLLNPQAKVILALSYVALCTLRYGLKVKNGEITKEDYAKLMVKDTLAFLIAIGVGDKIGEIIVAKVPSANQAVAVATQLLNA